jgi:demethylmenaquinone methyltransferase/2-methoxy-6-polyprenyl-1,4-benzoquinol methylase
MHAPSEPDRAARSAAPLRALDIERHLADPGLKQAYVTPMFDLIAPRYDTFTRRFSFGLDRRWKRELLEHAASNVALNGRVADLAAGTGDLAFGLARARRDLYITTVDIAPRMIELARSRQQREQPGNVTLTAGDLGSLALATSSLDALLAGYAIRNAPDWRVAVSEAARVLRPGGHLFTLDFYRPDSRIWRPLFLRWLWTAGRLFGWVWHREPMAYGYIARSVDHFVSWRTFALALEASAFRVRSVRSFLGGGIALHHAVRR